jgi:hypothetical protein
MALVLVEHDARPSQSGQQCPGQQHHMVMRQQRCLLVLPEVGLCLPSLVVLVPA